MTQENHSLPGRASSFAALLAFLALLLASSAWEMRTAHQEGELRLKQEARTLAKRASLYLAGVTWEMDGPAARSSIYVEMEDLRLAAMRINDREGLLEGMRRNKLWEPVPWDDLIPENCVEASAPILVEDLPVGEISVYLSRRQLDEELYAKAQRELLRIALLAAFPCLGLALLLWQLAVRSRTALHEAPPFDKNLKIYDTAPELSKDKGQGKAADSLTERLADKAPDKAASSLPERLANGLTELPPEPATPKPEKNTNSAILALPPDWQTDDKRRRQLAAYRDFMQEHRSSAALLYRFVAREDWAELYTHAERLQKAASQLGARQLADRAQAVREAALGNTGAAARRVEDCIPALARVFSGIEALLREDGEDLT